MTTSNLHSDEIHCIVLAAGSSQRFDGDKTEICLHGKPMSINIALILQAITPNVLLIINQNNKNLQQAADKQGINCIINKQNCGIGSSISQAITASLQAKGWLICLGDMPFIQPDTYQRIYAALLQGDTHSIVLPRYNTKAGHPAGFSSVWKTQLQNLTGDSGARAIINKNTQHIRYIEVDDSGIHIDIDTQDDLKNSFISSV
ncbi:MAG TPA: nucleotidyltransferase family protein [Gammaproteobacteria bacterium]|nr:nucleotidyltransferase family protein [Gammaproteobacteria bacterium]